MGKKLTDQDREDIHDLGLDQEGTIGLICELWGYNKPDEVPDVDSSKELSND